MSVKKMANLPKNQIQRTRSAIRRSWSPTKREQRRQLADAKQQRLYSIRGKSFESRAHSRWYVSLSSRAHANTVVVGSKASTSSPPA